MDRQEVSVLLRANGFKVTPQRLAVYMLLQGLEDQPTADILYRKLVEKYPTLSLATVYKTLEMYIRIGLVQRVDMGEDSCRYDANMDNHLYIRCDKCGKVMALTDIDDSSLLADVSKVSGYTIRHRQLFFYGQCSQCQGNEDN
ncbi:MAG: transcriptional repressor [Anaerovibrio sp.]|uniref:Fur family transcriptional regulator n=1 Tax=Anaerovibrio sp. TaxID=1872532 RepID=UPI0025D72165|nr:Fur family transcriptional regulator [Anaerovibrio sp.]MCR5176634.1 transcriptional repressor [Anaerovibrio sp.]